MHVGFDISDATFPDLAIIFFEDKRQLGIRFPDTADQVLFLRKPARRSSMTWTTWSAFSSVLPVGIVT